MADEERLLKFVKKIAVEQKFETFDVKITPVSSGGANYTSKLYRIKISGKGRDDLNLFAKAAVMGEKMRGQALIKPFDSEKLAYTNLFKTYRHLEEKHGVPEENMLKFPKYYGSDMTYMQEILLLEDLTSRGFKSANRFESVDWHYAAAAITELAKFHALSIAFEHEYPSEFDKTLITFPSGMFRDTEESKMLFKKPILSALAIVREENKDKLEKFVEGYNFIETVNDLHTPLRRKVLMHVDFRPNNMLHRVKDDGTTEVIPVDYQTIQAGSPVGDLLYFIVSATDGKFRAKYFQKLVNHYHSELGVALTRLGLDVEDKYSKKDFEFELEKKLPLGLMIAVVMLPFLTVPEDQAPTLDDTVEMTSFDQYGTGNLYSQRLNEFVDDYVQWGVL